MTHYHPLRFCTSRLMLAVTTITATYPKGISLSFKKTSCAFHFVKHTTRHFSSEFVHTSPLISACLAKKSANQGYFQFYSSNVDDGGVIDAMEKQIAAISGRHKYETISKKKINEKKGKHKKYKEKSKIKEKRILRIDRILSNRGLGSRSQMHDLVKKKRVAIKDERTGNLIRAKGPSERVPKDATIFVDGEEIKPLPLLLVYHKPIGVLSAMKDDAMGRRHLGEVLEPRYIKAGLHPVGRLDYDTSGLILFSSNGDLTQRLLHPRYEIEKEYVATVENPVNANTLKNKLENGVETTEGTHKAKLLEVSEVFVVRPNEIDQPKNEDSLTEFEHAQSGGFEEKRGKENEPQSCTNIRLVVSEGKHRMVRRMLANVGHPVVELKRERHGLITLKDTDVGEFRSLNSEELLWVQDLLSHSKPK